MTRTVTALFDTKPDAEAGKQRLLDANIGADHIHIHDKSSEGIDQGYSDHQNTGLWSKIKNAFLPDEDRHTYEEGVRRGGYLLTADVDENESDAAVAALEAANGVDIDERASEWRSQGWSAPADRAGATLGAEGSGLRDRVLAAQGLRSDRTGDPLSEPLSSETLVGTDGQGGTPRGEAYPADWSATERRGTETLAGETLGQGRDFGSDRNLGAGQGEQVIPLAEEQLVVGKREVGRGGVRVRSYVTEQPVHEQVRLRQERVNVERRAVDQPISGLANDPFQERTIEMTETNEEAVVGKQARVVEEVVVSKQAGERTEEIDDTVRRTDVEIEDFAQGGRDRAEGTRESLGDRAKDAFDRFGDRSDRS